MDTQREPSEPLTPYQQARVLIEAVAVLHERGYGRLHLVSYVKEGLGAWRHMLFATDSYTPQSGPLPEIVARGSLPGHAVAKGGTPREMADDIERRYPDMIAASRGSLPEHVRWYRELLEAYPGKAFELENMPHVNVL